MRERSGYNPPVHRFALLTAVFVVWLGMFAATLPAAAKYPDAEDEWLPERYSRSLLGK